MTNEEAKAHMDMLIAHKDKAIETHPYLRCDSCTHSEEQDGSNCYECVKGMADNFEAQPKTSYISVDLNKFAKEVAEKALDEITYEGKTIREWAEIIVKQQQSWIPVSERLPEELEPVSITWINHNPESYYADIKDKPFTATGVRFNGQWYWWSTLCTDILAAYSHNYDDIIDDDIEITAWMPLPEPYKAESEE